MSGAHVLSITTTVTQEFLDNFKDISPYLRAQREQAMREIMKYLERYALIEERHQGRDTTISVCIVDPNDDSPEGLLAKKLIKMNEALWEAKLREDKTREFLRNIRDSALSQVSRERIKEGIDEFLRS